MKRIFILILFLTTTVNLSAQISSSDVQGINCNTPMGYVALDAIISYPSTAIWVYKSNGSWVDVSSLSFATVSATKDTLFTSECGLYKVSFYYDNIGLPVEEIDSFAVSCPITIGQGQDPIVCYGDSSGTLKRPVFGGTKFDPDSSFVLNDTLNGDEYYMYTWYYADDSIGMNSVLLTDTTENLLGIPAGWYKAVITDAIGCSDSIDYLEFKNPQKIRVDTQVVDHNKCIGDTTASMFLRISGGKKYNITNKYFYYLVLNTDTVSFSDLSGSTPNFTYLSNSNNMQDFYPDSIMFNDLAAGSYILSVVDSNSCIMLDTIEVLEPEVYTVYSSTTYPLICASDSAVFLIDSVTGGNSMINYYFLGFGNDTINVPAGTYDVFVKDLQFGCDDTLSVSFNAQYEIEIESTINNILCYGDSSGMITIDSISGGNAPYIVQWGGVNTQSISAGNYTVFIADSLGCTLMQDFIVGQGESFSANPVFYPPSCYGFSDGSIAVDVTGGTGQLSYYWLNGTGNLDSLYGLSSGIYSLVITDSLSCIDTLELMLYEPEEISFAFANFEDTLLCRGEVTVVDVVISGGTGPFLVSWNDLDSNVQRWITAGIYSCEVSDENGCTTPNTQIVITEPDHFSIQNTSFNNATCDAGGNAEIITVGGTNPIHYIWSTGDTIENIDSLFGSNYWVIATDYCGNSDTAYFDLIPFELITNLTYDNLTHIAFVEVDNTSTGGPFSYQWTNLSGDIISVDSITSALCEGTYYVTTTDNTSNCSVTDTLVATYYLPNGIVDVTTTTVLADADLWGFAPYTYFWDTGEITQHANICPGSHWVEVTDKDGCLVREDFEIEELIISLDPAAAIIECNLENLDIDLEASATGGIEPYVFQWWNGSTENPINLGMSPGNFSVMVTDANGCIEDTAFVIATITSECIPNVFTPNGDNINDTWDLEDTFLYSDSEVKIYGRFGKLLFQSVGYHEPWNGTNEKGNDVPAGVYFYSIEIGHSFDAIKGTVTILR